LHKHHRLRRASRQRVFINVSSCTRLASTRTRITCVSCMRVCVCVRPCLLMCRAPGRVPGDSPSARILPVEFKGGPGYCFWQRSMRSVFRMGSLSLSLSLSLALASRCITCSAKPEEVRPIRTAPRPLVSLSLSLSLSLCLFRAVSLLGPPSPARFSLERGPPLPGFLCSLPATGAIAAAKRCRFFAMEMTLEILSRLIDGEGDIELYREFKTRESRNLASEARFISSSRHCTVESHPMIVGSIVGGANAQPEARNRALTSGVAITITRWRQRERESSDTHEYLASR